MIGSDDVVDQLAGELIELSFPASRDLVVLARFTAATVAARAGFDVEEIEDLRLAVDELCVSAGPIQEGAAVHLEFSRIEDSVRIVCVLEALAEPPGSEAVGVGGTAASVRNGELSEQLLDSLVDEHGSDTRRGHPCAWLWKRRGDPQR